ncbi:MAG: FtsX-like permease family protein, partial [Planctomycetota bacterium]
RQLHAGFGVFDFELTPLDLSKSPASLRTSLQADPDVAAVGLMQPSYANMEHAGIELGPVRLFGLNPLPSEVFAQYLVTVGEDLSDLDPETDVLIAAKYAELRGIKIGDEITLRAPDVSPRMLCKDGLLIPLSGGEAQDPGPVIVRVKGLLADVQLGRQYSGVVMVGTTALSELFAAGERAAFQVNRRPGSNVDVLRRRLQEEFQVRDERSALLGEASDERAFRNGVKILGCLALVLGMFVVFQTLSQSLVERLRQIGLLRCLGTSRNSVLGIFLLDALMLSFMGVALGMGAGVALAYGMKSMGFTTLGIGQVMDSFEIPSMPLVWTGAMGMLFTLAGASFPLYKARNLPALSALRARGLGAEGGSERVDVLRGVNLFLFLLLALFLPAAYLAMTPLLLESERETLLVLGQLGGMILVFGALLLLVPRLVRTGGEILLRPLRGSWSLPAFLIRKNLAQQPGRFAASVCGLAVVLVAVIALKSITWSLRAEVRQFGARALEGRVFVSGPAVEAEDALAFKDLAGVRSVRLYEGVRSVPFQLVGIDDEEMRGSEGLLAGSEAMADAYVDERKLIISERLAYLQDVSVGDRLDLLTDEGPVSYEVLLVSDEVGYFPYERAWAVTHPRWLVQDYCQGPASVERLVIQLEEGVNPYRFIDRARGFVPGFNWMRAGRLMIWGGQREVTVDFLLFDVLMLLVLGLAGLGIINAMTIAAMGRAREIGVLRALGTSKRQLLRSILLEGALVGVMSAVLAVLLSLPLAVVVVAGLNRVAGLSAPLTMPWPYLIALPVLAVAVGCLAAVVPALRAIRQSPVESVRYE